MKQYHEHLEAILKYGHKKEAQRGQEFGTLSLFGYQNRYKLSEGFPIVTTKKTNFHKIVVELLWFLRGDTNVKFLNDNGFTEWNEDAYAYYTKVCKKYNETPMEYSIFIEFIQKGYQVPNIPENSGYKLGDCGKQYGWLWRGWKTGKEISKRDGTYPNEEIKWKYEEESIDQIKNLIDMLKNSPDSRRLIITAWNPATISDCALPPCHSFVQFNTRRIDNVTRANWAVSNYRMHRNEIMFDIIENPDRTLEQQLDDNNIPKYYLDCQMYQRSADMFLGVPFNISSYCLLTHLLCKITNMIPGDFIHTFGDSHIYDNHMDQVKELLKRDPEKYKLPTLKFHNAFESDVIRLGEEEVNLYNFIRSLEPDDFQLEGYESYPYMKADIVTGIKK